MGAAGKIALDIAGQAAGGLVGAGMGMLMEGHNDRRQLEQQRKLQALQMAGSKEMAEFNRQQQMKMWEDTNYKAQMEQLKKAGLNPGLIYGMSGSGGATTAAAQAAGPQGANAPVGGGEAMGLMMQGAERQMQLRLLQAQKENIEADTANKQAETGFTTGAKTANTVADTKLKEIESRIKDVEAEVQGRTIEDQIDIITAEASSATTDALRVQRQNHIEQATMETVMDKIKADYIGVLLKNTNLKADTKLKGAQTATETERPAQIRTETHAIASGIVQRWRDLELQGQRITTDQIQSLTGGANITNELVNAIQTILLMKAAAKPGGTTPIRGFHKR